MNVRSAFLATVLAFTLVPSARGQYPADEGVRAERRRVVEYARAARAERAQRKEPDCIAVPGRTSAAPGGCRLLQNGVIYGPSEWIDNRLQVDGWTSRPGAMIHCVRSGRGGTYGWRLPTKSEVLAAGPYLEAMGIDPYLFHWTSERWMTTKTVVKEREVPGMAKTETVERRSVLLGQSTSSDYYPFDPVRRDNASDVYGTAEVRERQFDHRLRAEFDFHVEHFALVRAAVGDGQEIQRYTPGDSRASISWKTQREVETPVAGQRSYDRYLGQSWGTRVYEAGRETKTEAPEVQRRSVDPQQFHLEVATPSDVTVEQIGLFCVRED